MTRDTRGRLHINVTSSVAANPPRSCTQHSVTVPPEAGAKFAQELAYGTEERHTTYASLRNTNEGMNGFLKDPAHEGTKRMFDSMFGDPRWWPVMLRLCSPQGS